MTKLLNQVFQNDVEHRSMKSFTFSHSPQLMGLGLVGVFWFLFENENLTNLAVSLIFRREKEEKTHLSLQRLALHQLDLQSMCHNYHTSSVIPTMHYMVFHH